MAVLVSVAVAATGEAGAPTAEALAAGYRAGFRWAVAFPLLIVLAALALPVARSREAAREIVGTSEAGISRVLCCNLSGGWCLRSAACHRCGQRGYGLTWQRLHYL